MKQVTTDNILQLIDYFESVAKQLLVTKGEFHPFGAFINPQGEIEAMGAQIGTAHPNSKDQYIFLHDTLLQMAREGRLIAFGSAANVNIPPHLGSHLPEGIRLHIEAPGYSRHIYTPYRLLPHQGIRKFLGFVPTIEYAETMSVEIDPTVFSPADPN